MTVDISKLFTDLGYSKSMAKVIRAAWNSNGTFSSLDIQREEDLQQPIVSSALKMLAGLEWVYVNKEKNAKGVRAHYTINRSKILSDIAGKVQHMHIKTSKMIAVIADLHERETRGSK